jgi:hypothetical protein
LQLKYANYRMIWKLLLIFTVSMTLTHLFRW